MAGVIECLVSFYSYILPFSPGSLLFCSHSLNTISIRHQSSDNNNKKYRKNRRRALHQYDPADQLRQQPSSASITLVPRPCSTEEDVQAEEIAQAKASGLQVAFGSMNVGQEARLFSMKVAPDDDNDNELMMMMKNSGASGASGVKDNNDNGQVETMTNDMKYFDEEAAYQRAMMIGGGGGGGGDAYANFLEECESDSDDDIL